MNAWAGVVAIGMFVSSGAMGVVSHLGDLGGSGGCARSEVLKGTTSAEHTGLWVMEADGSNPRRLVGGSGDGYFAWSPGSDQLASWSHPSEGSAPNTLFVSAADGSTQRGFVEPLVASSSDLVNGNPAIDIAWTSHLKISFTLLGVKGASQTWDRYEMNADGSARARILGGPSAAQISVSPDGTKLAFVTLDDGQIYVSDIDGTGQRQLTGDDIDKFSPAWAPNSDRIVFASESGSANDKISRLEVIRIDGGDRVVVSSSEDGSSYDNVRWSPDGQWIAFDRSPHEDWGWVGVVRPSGEDRRNLTPRLDKPVSHDPTWSPTGQSIAITDGSGISIASLDDKRRKCLTVGEPGRSHSPQWSPDGTRIAFFRS